MKQKRIDEAEIALLIKSFDTELSDQERYQLKAALERSPELLHEQENLLALRKSLGSSRSDFKPFFEARVLAAIASEANNSRAARMVESMTVTFRKVALAGAVAAVVLAAVNMSTQQEISIPAAFALEEQQESSPLQTPFEMMTE